VTPCLECAKRAVNAGIARVVWSGEYDSAGSADASVALLNAARVRADRVHAVGVVPVFDAPLVAIADLAHHVAHCTGDDDLVRSAQVVSDWLKDRLRPEKPVAKPSRPRPSFDELMGEALAVLHLTPEAACDHREWVAAYLIGHKFGWVEKTVPATAAF